MNGEFINARAFFSKTGNAKYISHLDLYRAMGRVVKRCGAGSSGLPVWITEGFNPHIYMTFALPLALGIESEEESVDLRLTDDIPFEEVAARLDAAAPAGLRIIRVAPPIRKANEIEKATYAVSGRAEEIGAIDGYLSSREIVITKKTKKSVQTLDVKPLLKWENQRLTLPAGNTLNINPWNVLSGLSDVSASITRTEILCADGKRFC